MFEPVDEEEFKKIFTDPYDKILQDFLETGYKIARLKLPRNEVDKYARNLSRKGGRYGVKVYRKDYIIYLVREDAGGRK